MAQQGDLLRRLTTLMADRDAAQPLSTGLCDAYRQLTGADAAALTVDYSTPHRVTLSTTNDVARQLEDLQDVLGEGPGHSASSSGQIEVCAIPGTASSRWSIFVEAAQDLVDRALIHAIPMRPQREVFGVLTLYSPREGALTLERSHLQFLANVVGAALLGDRDAVEPEEPGPWLSRSKIHQATGMVVAQLHITPEDALAVLRAHAYGQQSTLSEIASAVVERRVKFTT